MTTRQQRRLELAESVCRLVMKDQSCGLVEGRGYCPDVVSALHFMQSEGEKQGNIPAGSLHWLGSIAESIRMALFTWMEAIGIDPKSYEKQATQRMAMELARDAFGDGYEAEPEQLGDAKKFSPWVEKTADERASALSFEFFSGKIRSHDELRIAIAAEIFEAEQAARAPFLEYCRVIFQACEDGMTDDRGEAMKEATVNLLCQAGRWMDIKPKKSEEGRQM